MRRLGGHDLLKRVIQQLLNRSVHQRVQIPKSVNLHQIRVITGQG